MQAWQRRTYIILLICNVAYAFGLGLYMNFLPLFYLEVGADPIIIGFLYALSFVTLSLATIFGGFLADRIDKKKLLIASFFITAVAPLFYMIANNWILVIPGILVESFSYFAWPVVESYLAAITPEKQRGFYFNIYWATMNIGLIPAPFLGGLIINIFGYSILFALASFGYFVSAVFVLLVSPVKKSAEGEGFLQLFKRRKLWGIFALTATVNSAFAMVSPYVSLFMKDVHNLLEAEIGLIMTINNLIASVISPLIGRFADKVGKPQAMLFPIGSLFLSHLLLVVVPQPNLLILFALSYAPWWCFLSLVSSYVVEHLPPGDQGKGLGVSQFLSQFPRAFTPALGGQLYTTNNQLPFQALQILSVPALAFVGYTVKSSSPKTDK